MKTFAFIITFLLSFISVQSFAQLPQTDQVETDNGTLTVQPIQHGTVVLNSNNKTIYVDPVGGAEAFEGLDSPDIILITHIHGDHLSVETLDALNTENTTIIMPQSVADELSEKYGNQRVILNNGENTQEMGINILAMPMYNLPKEDARHPKGWGNGYVLTIADKRVYISGDTEGIPEMRSLKNIDMAFVCMNLPYTMDVQQAADAVLDFKPAIIYPYHHRGQDIEKFKQLVNAKNNDIEVRLLNWYK